MSIRKALAEGAILDEINSAALESIAESIALQFTTIANLDPMFTLGVLEQLNNQINEEAMMELIVDRKERIEVFAEALVISEEDL